MGAQTLPFCCTFGPGVDYKSHFAPMLIFCSLGWTFTPQKSFTKVGRRALEISVGRETVYEIDPQDVACYWCRPTLVTRWLTANFYWQQIHNISSLGGLEVERLLHKKCHSAPVDRVWCLNHSVKETLCHNSNCRMPGPFGGLYAR